MAEERFKAIAEAYAVLSDPQKRERYDELGSEDFGEEFSHKDIFQGFDPTDLFKEFGLSATKETLDRILDPDSAEEREGGKFADFFAGFGQKAGRRRREKTKAPDLFLPLHLSLKDAVYGARKGVAFNSVKGVIKLHVTVPPGTLPGALITVPEKVPGTFNQSPGDLKINVSVSPDVNFRREGLDIVTNLKLSAKDLRDGSRPLVPTLKGPSLLLSVPPGTAPGTKLKAKGRGAPGPKGAVGDLIIKIILAP